MSKLDAIRAAGIAKRKKAEFWGKIALAAGVGTAFLCFLAGISIPLLIVFALLKYLLS